MLFVLELHIDRLVAVQQLYALILAHLSVMPSVDWDAQRLMPLHLVSHLLGHHFLNFVIEGNRRLKALLAPLDAVLYIQVG